MARKSTTPAPAEQAPVEATEPDTTTEPDAESAASDETADAEPAHPDLGSVLYFEPGKEPIEVPVVDGDPTGEGVLVVKLPEVTVGEGAAEVTQGGGYPAVMYATKANIGAAYWKPID